MQSLAVALSLVLGASGCSDVVSPDPGAPAPLIIIGAPPVFLVLDEEVLKPGEAPNYFSESDLNAKDAEIGVRTPLPFFASAANQGAELTLYSGQVGDEGWFAVTQIPEPWASAGPTEDGLTNYVQAGPGLGSPDAKGDRESLLDKVPGVTPLRATGLGMLVGRIVCALGYPSDIGINYGPLNGSLKGKTFGLAAFEVVEVTARGKASSSTLPKVRIRVMDPESTCAGPLELLLDAPEPVSSSQPRDVVP
jgi:hypothetical protein